MIPPAAPASSVLTRHASRSCLTRRVPAASRFYVGDVVEATETDDGLTIKGRFDLDTEFGKSAYRNTKGRRVSGLSIGYAIRNSTKTAAGNELTELELIEMPSAVFAHDGGGDVAPQPRASKHSQPLPIPSQKNGYSYTPATANGPRHTDLTKSGCN